jgi:hypothetical protein
MGKFPGGTPKIKPRQDLRKSLSSSRHLTIGAQGRHQVAESDAVLLTEHPFSERLTLTQTTNAQAVRGCL